MQFPFNKKKRINICIDLYLWGENVRYVLKRVVYIIFGRSSCELSRGSILKN